MTIIKYWVGEMLRFFVAVERLPPAVVDDRLRLFVAVERTIFKKNYRFLVYNFF